MKEKLLHAVVITIASVSIIALGGVIIFAYTEMFVSLYHLEWEAAGWFLLAVVLGTVVFYGAAAPTIGELSYQSLLEDEKSLEKNEEA